MTDPAAERREPGTPARALGSAPGPARSPAPDPAAPARLEMPEYKPEMPEYKGAALDPDRGPGLGCFYVQLVILAVLIVLTPLTVAWNWPPAVSAVLLLLILVLLLLVGQTVVFLLRLVAAERGRRRPLGGSGRTVGELEEAGTASGTASDAGRPDSAPDRSSGDGGSMPQ